MHIAIHLILESVAHAMRVECNIIPSNRVLKQNNDMFFWLNSVISHA